MVAAAAEPIVCEAFAGKDIGEAESVEVGSVIFACLLWKL